MAAADFLEICRGFHTAHVEFETSFQAVADVCERFFHPLDVGERVELWGLAGDFELRSQSQITDIYGFSGDSDVSHMAR